jgi:hypothetical protein
MQKRWLVYILIGLIFGWADWYFLDFLASFSQNQALNDAVYELPVLFRLVIVGIIIALNYGVWLIPVIPTAVYEMKFSSSVWRAALAAAIVWSAALLSYYAYYTFLLMYIGLPNLDFMLFSNRHAATYWIDFWPPFRRVILDQIVEWIGIGIVGGAIISTISAYFYKFVLHKSKLMT